MLNLKAKDVSSIVNNKFIDEFPVFKKPFNISLPERKGEYIINGSEIIDQNLNKFLWQKPINHE